MKLLEYIKNPKKILLFLGGYNIIPIKDDYYLKLLYKARLNKELDLNCPKSFNEKLQWLKLNNKKEIYTSLVDKYEVKKHIEKLIGKQYVIPTIGIYNKFKDIDFEILPNKFVIKCTHDSGGVVICKDKKLLNIKKLKRKINKSLKRNFFYLGREWPYKNVKPRIIIEELLEDYSHEEIVDYKLLCFNGKVKCSFIASERRSKEGLAVDFYDHKWQHMPFTRHYRNSGKLFPMPKNYDLMVALAEKLALDIPFVRVDFYEINNQVYFGELTFFPGDGLEEFYPEKWDYILGDWIDLEEVK